MYLLRPIPSAFCFVLVAANLSAAPTPTPTPPNAIFDYSVGRLAADPVRSRVYATVPNANSVIVIDTTSLTLTATIPIGSSPKGLAVSADGARLWVANSGSTNFAIGVVDLKTLTALPSLSTPVRPSDIVEGAGHRLYVTPGQQSGGIMQIDAATGAYQRSFGDFEVYTGSLLAISPDRNTLFFGNTGLSPSTMVKYDTATAVPSVVQQGSFGSYGQGLSVSHNGQLLVFPNGGGNAGYATFEIPTANINSVNGTFNVGAYTVAATFSNDDTLLYHGTSSQGVVKIFDTTTFNLAGTIALGNRPGTSYGYDVRDVVVDRSGRWLFVATNDYTMANLLVFDTGRIDPLPAARLGNISTRLRVGQADAVSIAGFIVSGNDPKRVIIRGIGPSLAQSFSDFLADPTLELYQGNTLLASNDNWKSDQQAEIEATGIPPNNDLESAIVRTLAPGAYTAILRGRNDSIGIGLVEVYDLNQSTNSRLGNISTRGLVDLGDNVMIGGLIVPPTFANVRVIVRAIGPSLSDVGVQGALQDPILELHDGSGTAVAINDNWKISDTGGSQQAEIEATMIPPADDRESALVRNLAPGNYTVIVRGKNNTTGVALVEAYNLPE